MILFISDLHLCGERPDITGKLLNFLHTRARHCDGLYILGDMFEAWVGDDLLDDAESVQDYLPVIDALAELTAGGTPVHIMHGNRDFLLGEGFARRCGCTLLPDPLVIDLYGTPTLISHGDLFCIDDTGYQKFRTQVRDPSWQQAMLQQSLEQRLQLAQQYREESRRQNRGKAEHIMDVNQGEVERLMKEHGVRRLIHGHTHRPAVHHFALDGEQAERIVLAAWYEQGSYLACGPDACRVEPVPT